jgi:HSP20 family molecular chaperone IbpA
MFLSLRDLIGQQTGWPLPETAMDTLEPALVDAGPELLLRLPLTEIDPRSVQVQVSETSLQVAGHRSREETVEGPGFFRSSTAFGAFARSWPLPVRVIPRECRAAWAGGGLLEVRLRKA